MTLLSIAPDHPVDHVVIEILIHVDHMAQELGLEYFVTGATARDILLTGVFGLETGRATHDVDLGVVVDGWPRFDAVKARLVATQNFIAAEDVVHRLLYRGRTGYPLDLIPFGGIEGPASKIAWPPDRTTIMNVAGYREALAATQTVEIHPGVLVPIVSLPGLAILKLFAWADRGAANHKDATDLVTLLRHYSAAGNEDRLFGVDIGVLEAVSYDIDRAGPRLLGRDVARITARETQAAILELLEGVRLDRLIQDMARETRIFSDNPIAVAGELIAQFKFGLRGL